MNEHDKEVWRFHIAVSKDRQVEFFSTISKIIPILEELGIVDIDKGSRHSHIIKNPAIVQQSAPHTGKTRDELIKDRRNFKNPLIERLLNTDKPDPKDVAALERQMFG